MYEYEIEHIDTGDRVIIHGYNFDDACARCHIEFPEEWVVLVWEYID